MQRVDKDNQPVFYVKDNGTGIASNQIERVFGLFQKLDPGIEGTGIGLALVKRIIEIHGGKIWIESAGIGHGTTLYFRFLQHENDTGLKARSSHAYQRTAPHDS